MNRRLRRISGNLPTAQTEFREPKSWGQIWLTSFLVWGLIGLVATISAIQLFHHEGRHIGAWVAAGMQFSQMLPFAFLTPFVFVLVDRYPIHRRNWIRLSPLYLAGGLIFTTGHVGLRGVTPYGVWDSKARVWRSPIWDYQSRRLDVQWRLFEGMFLENVFDDVTSSYLPVVLLAYVLAYYSRLAEREKVTANLEAELAKANLHALKSQLQPHFLFNTMHSISSLMFSDAAAADRMMTRLSELLRVNLEETEQITTLKRELEFVNGYLEIEKMRFGERLTVLLDIAADTLDVQFPHLLLQPFVENAVQHGIGKLPAKGKIEISSRRNAHNLYVTVRDNGPGFRFVADSPPALGVGIKASQERLRALYGANHMLEFGSKSAEGGEVTIRIPFRPFTGEGA